MGRPSPLGPHCGPRFMGLPKNMPHPAVGSIQTSLRKGLPSSIVLLRRVLPGGGSDGASCGLYDAAGVGESRLSQPAAAPDPGTDSTAVGGAWPAVERSGEPATRGRFSDAVATATGDRAAVRPAGPVVALLLSLLRGYKLLISPWLPSACRFEPTCSCYMHGAIAEHGAVKGILLGVRRLLKCHPWHEGGIDRVPPFAHPNRTEMHGR